MPAIVRRILIWTAAAIVAVVLVAVVGAAVRSRVEAPRSTPADADLVQPPVGR